MLYICIHIPICIYLSIIYGKYGTDVNYKRPVVKKSSTSPFLPSLSFSALISIREAMAAAAARARAVERRVVPGIQQ